MPRRLPYRQEQHDADGDGDRVDGAGRGWARRLVSAAVPADGLHGDRHRVVDEQGDRGDLGDLGSEVVPGHHVGAAGLGVERSPRGTTGSRRRGRPRMARVIGHHQGEGGQARRTAPAGSASPRCRRPTTRCSRAPARPRAIGLAQPLGRQLLGDERRAEQPVLQPVAAGSRGSSVGRPTPGSGDRSGLADGASVVATATQ